MGASLCVKAMYTELAKTPVKVQLLGDSQGVRIYQSEPHAIYDIVPWGADERVPHLFLSVYGQLQRPAISVEELCQIIDVRHDLQAFISMAVNPLTCSPGLSIHPCKTAEWLAEVDPQNEGSSHSSWILWLACIGQGIGLDTHFLKFL